MRKVSVLALLCLTSFFVLMDWVWISKYNVLQYKKENETISCGLEVRNALSICKNCLPQISPQKSSKIASKKQDNNLLLFSSFPSSPKYLIIGIPTIFRKKENYLHQTLQSLIDNMDDSERNNVTILVVFADPDPELRMKRAKETALKFPKSLQSGLLLLIQIPESFYPNVKITRRTFNDTLERIKWRSKQVADFAFMFTYAQNLSEYFLILEDDVVTVSHYVTAIRRFVQERENRDWVSLTFSSFYIIGRLFKGEYLKKLSQFLMMFHTEKPVDWLIIQFLDLLVPNKQVVTRRVPGLFQHIGLFSSLEGKVQKAKDRSFSTGTRRFHFMNPPADLVTTLGVYKKHFPDLCYTDSDRFFWGSAPRKNDTFDVILQRPSRLRRIFISSGQKDHKDDIIKYAKLDVSPRYRKMLTNKKAECEDFTTLALFESGQVDVLESLLAKVAEIQCIRIEFIKKQSNWILINEISIDSKTNS